MGNKNYDQFVERGEALKWAAAAYDLYCNIGKREMLAEVRLEQLKLGETPSQKDRNCPPSVHAR